MKQQGIDLNDSATVAMIRLELGPDVKILQADIQNALATGFSTAARASALLASIFVLFGALSSLMLPQSKPHTVAENVISAH